MTSIFSNPYFSSKLFKKLHHWNPSAGNVQEKYCSTRTSRLALFYTGAFQTLLWFHHRRRMEREAKANVVASVWGAEFIQFLATLAVLPQSILKKRLNSSYSILPLPLLLSPSFFYGFHVGLRQAIQEKKFF